jgi:hypothetical protein
MMQSLGLRGHDQSQAVSVQPHAATIRGYEFTHKRTVVFRVVYPFAYTIAHPM